MNTVADTRTLTERSEEELSWAGLALAETFRAAEFALIALIALLVCPPLLILAVVVIVPAVIVAAVIGLIALPVLALRHLFRHRADVAHARVHRLAQWGRDEPSKAVAWLRRALYVDH